MSRGIDIVMQVEMMDALSVEHRRYEVVYTDLYRHASHPVTSGFCLATRTTRVQGLSSLGVSHDECSY